MKKLLLLMLACNHSGPYAMPTVERLGRNVVSIDVTMVDPSRKELVLFKYGMEACPEGFKLITDDVDSHFGALRGAFIIRCGDDQAPCTPGQALFGCRSTRPPESN